MNHHRVVLAAIGALCFSLCLLAITDDASADTDTAEAPQQNEKERREDVAKSTGAAPPATQALRVYKDPKTGRFVRPPAASRDVTEAMRRLLSRSTEGLTPRTLPSGAIALDLQGRFMNLSVATRNPDGTISTRCIHRAPHAEKHHDDTPNPETAPAEERDDK